MNQPSHEPANSEGKYDINQIILFENRVSSLMFDIASRLAKSGRSVQLMRDDNFVHRRERTSNDIHVFLELKDGGYFHLRAYTRHMLDINALPTEEIYLTGYLKQEISHTGGEHALRQGWYKWDAESIANEVVRQNPSLF